MIGVYAYRDNDPGSSFGVTSLMACGLAAWAVGAVLAGEPDAQSDMATAALGGRGARAGLEVMLVARRGGRPDHRVPRLPARPRRRRGRQRVRPRRAGGDVVAAGLGHLSCAALGGAVGVLFAPPRLTRRATAIAAVVAALLALVAVSAALGPVGGPVAFAPGRDRRARREPSPARCSSPARAASSSPARSSPARPGGPPAAADRDPARIAPCPTARRHPIFARLYAASSPGVERKGGAEHRAEMLAGPRRPRDRGRRRQRPELRPLPGDGDRGPRRRARALPARARREEAAARGGGRRARSSTASPTPCPAEDGAFDAAVASLVLCSVPDQARALAELRRVRPPRRRAALLRARRRAPAAAARCSAGSTTGASGRALTGGCHGARDTEAAIAASGLTIERVRRFDFKAGPVALPHIIGVARRDA